MVPAISWPRTIEQHHPAQPRYEYSLDQVGAVCGPEVVTIRFRHPRVAFDRDDGIERVVAWSGVEHRGG
jgi:hypothetical protein